MFRMTQTIGVGYKAHTDLGPDFPNTTKRNTGETWLRNHSQRSLVLDLFVMFRMRTTIIVSYRAQTDLGP